MSTTLSKDQKRVLRAELFKHLEGFPVASTVSALHERGVIDYLSAEGSVYIDQVSTRFDANEGYMNVALRLLASQGWLRQINFETDTPPEFELLEKGKEAFSYADKYAGTKSVLKLFSDLPERFDLGLSAYDLDVLDRARQLNQSLNSDVDNGIESEVRFHIRGLVCGPLLVQLGMSGYLDGIRNNNTTELISALRSEEDCWPIIRSIFHDNRWLHGEGDSLEVTEEGLFFLKRASAYGVTVSYIKTFISVEELLFGKGDVFWDRPLEDPEIHVDRTMNVWGSGGAHSVYFEKIDEIVLDIFNKPIEEQPKGIADMGCGNGAFLQHLYEVVSEKTSRGNMLDEHPLLLIGSDFNQAALEATRKTLSAAGIDFHVLHGDIGNPKDLADNLKNSFDVNLEDMLNVRSFLDHNRMYRPPEDHAYSRKSISTGAYAFRGRRIPNGEVEQNLYEHFKSWLPYVEKFGLLVIELHTIPPSLASENIGKTAITAYDGTHGYSDQYIVELDVFLAMAKEAGLNAVPAYSSKFPPSDLATVSINLLKA